MSHHRHSKGFTLIELLIALAIFAAISAFSYAIFNQTAIHSERITKTMSSLQLLQRSLQAITADLVQTQQRPVREPGSPTQRPPLLADARNVYLLELTRGGYANPLSAPRATALRVAYRLDDGELIRTQWPALDNPLNAEPRELVLLEDVERFEFRFLGDGGQWQTQWPQSGSGSALPRAIEIFIEHPQWGEIRRLIEVAG